MWTSLLISCIIIVTYIITLKLLFFNGTIQPNVALSPIFVINANIDTEFTIKEKKRIIEALHMWQKASHGLIIFHLINMEAKNLIYNNDKSISCTMNFIKAHSSDSIIQKIDKKHNSIIFGYGVTTPNVSMAFLITNRMGHGQLFRAVTAHEIGHLLGLDHNPKKCTIMYQFTNEMSNYITNYDMKELIYNLRSNLNTNKELQKQEHNQHIA